MPDREVFVPYLTVFVWAVVSLLRNTLTLSAGFVVLTRILSPLNVRLLESNSIDFGALIEALSDSKYNPRIAANLISVAVEISTPGSEFSVGLVFSLI